jgi:ribosomal protein L12E/L44/L45/RPP1/RPP2
MASPSELGCVYAALILADDGIEVTVRALARVLFVALPSSLFLRLLIAFFFFCFGLWHRSLQGEKISTLLDAASVTYEPFWPSLFAKALTGRNVKDMVGPKRQLVIYRPAAVPLTVSSCLHA